MASNDLSGSVLVDDTDFDAVYRAKKKDLVDLVGSALDYRCGICRKLASEHIGGVVTDCHDKEIDDQAVSVSVQRQIRAVDDLMGRLSAVSSLSQQVSRLNVDVDGLHKLIADRDDSLAEKNAEVSDLEAVRDSLVERVCFFWRKWLDGTYDAQTICTRLDDEFGYHIAVADFPPTIPPETPGAMASDDSHAASSAPATASASGGAPSTGTSSGSSSAAAIGGAIDGDKVGKSTKTIKVEFAFNDRPVQHLQKEQSLINEIGLLYPNVSENTKVSMTISHCDVQVKDIAISVRDSRGGSFAKLDDFLTAFRNERYPSFDNDCRLALKEMRQRLSESSMQFFFRYTYLLRAMGRNVEEYRDEFLDKLLFPQVVKRVRFLPRSGRTLQQIAQHCNEVESELGCRKKAHLWGVEGDDETRDCFSMNTRRGGRSGRGGRGGRGGQSRGGAQRRTSSGSQRVSSSSVFSRVDTWGLKEGVCWHCFQQHSRSDTSCASDPCRFCKESGHRSAFCPSAPTTKLDFIAALKLSA